MCARYLTCLFVTLIICCAGVAHGQLPDTTFCGETGGGQSTSGGIVDGDTVRALVVLVKYRDDNSTPPWNVLDWPLTTDPSELPAFATGLIDPTPAPAAFRDSTISSYYYEQSRPQAGAPGRHVLYGDVVPYVHVSKMDEDDYSGLGQLTEEVLDSLFVQGYDFGDYDLNGDQVVDHIFFLLRARECSSSCWSGVSGIFASLQYYSPSQNTTISINSGQSGSYTMGLAGGRYQYRPHFHYVRVMAHEYGHDLWKDFFGHLGAFTGNDVPIDSDITRYALMSAEGTVHELAISTHERDLLGWIDAPVLTTSGAGTLSPLYGGGEAASIALSGDASGNTVFLSNRQRSGFFEQVYQTPAQDIGLLETGLLATFKVTSSERDVLPAQNILNLPVEYPIYSGVMYGGSGQKAQLTPWTRPNINGWTEYPSGYQPSWQAVDDIRYVVGDPDSTIAFDFYADFRAAPVVFIRADSWMGNETGGTVFPNEVRVTDGATLTVQSGIYLAFVGGLVVDEGARLEVASGATLAFGPGSRLIAEGDLVADGTTFTEATTGQGWGGIAVAGTFDAGAGTIVEEATVGVTVYEPGTATLAGVTLRHNTVGLDVLSDDGTVVSGSTVEQNGTGIRSGIPETIDGAVFCFGSCRSDFDLLDSVVESNTGYGVRAIDATAKIEGTFIRDNGGGGLYTANARVDAFPRNCIEDNGGIKREGATVLPGADLYLSLFNVQGETRIANSAGTELHISNGGYALVGDASTSSGDNAIFDTGGLLVYNGNNVGGQKDDVEAFYTWWGAAGGPSGGDFSPLGSVDFLPYRTSDPTLGICEIVQRPSPPTSPTGRALRAETAAGSFATNESIAGRGEREALRAAIRAARGALQADPAADSSAGLVRRLRGFHKQDRDDDLGEHGATFGLLRSLRARLNNPNLPEGLRATAEAALTAEALDALAAGDYEEAEALVTAWAPRVESVRVLGVLHMVEAHVAASTGDYAGAAALVEAVAAEADEAEAEPLLALAVVYAERAGETGARGDEQAARGSAPVEAATRGETGTIPDSPALAVYPNPFGRKAGVEVSVAAASEVRVVVYDVLGRTVAVLHEGPVEAGTRRFTLGGAGLPAGLYLVRAEISGPGGDVQALTARLTHVD